MILSQMAFALGACGGLARILMPSAVTMASREPVNWPARSLIRNFTGVVSWPVHQDVAGCLSRYMERLACLAHRVAARPLLRITPISG